MEFKDTFSPIKIGSTTVKNRLVVPAMDSGTFDPRGGVIQSAIDYYGARAKGGYGMIIVEIAAVDELASGMPHEFAVYDDEFIPGMKKLADAIVGNGAVGLVQLHHAGRETHSSMINHTPMAVSPLPSVVYREPVQEYTTEEIYKLIDSYVNAAVRCKTAGFNGVEIHSSHGYMGFQFLSPRTNKRIDEFGGSMEGRALFLKLVIQGIKEKCGNDFIVSIRLGTEEGRVGGITENEAVVFAQLLEEYGADVIDVSAGTYGTWNIIVPPPDMQTGWNYRASRRIKENVSIPVIGVGHFSEPFQIELAIRRGDMDMVATGRQSIADPNFPEKMKNGELMDIVPCIACTQRCMIFNDPAALEEGDVAVSCMFNPSSNNREEVRVLPADKKKKVVVVGGGPGGLMAAQIAAQKGHEVVLFEKEDKNHAGGQFLLAAYPPYKQELTRVIRHFLHMCEKYGVDMRFSTEATEDAIKAENPDAVIVATGATPIEPKIKGADQPHVVQANDVLKGKVVPGQNVLVIGGGLVGAETAEYCVDYAGKVSIVEMLPSLVPDLYLTVRDSMLQRFEDEKMDVHLNTKISEITADGAICETCGDGVQLNGYDTIVMAVGSKPYQPFANPDGLAEEVYVIGDAKEARSALEAIWEGFRAANGL